MAKIAEVDVAKMKQEALAKGAFGLETWWNDPAAYLPRTSYARYGIMDAYQAFRSHSAPGVCQVLLQRMVWVTFSVPSHPLAGQDAGKISVH
jgi:hypothetical protein